MGFGVWGLGIGLWGFGGWGLGFGGGVWGGDWWVGGLYVHTLVKNLLIKFLMMLFLVTKGCKFDSCCSLGPAKSGCPDCNELNVTHFSSQLNNYYAKVTFNYCNE